MERLFMRLCLASVLALLQTSPAGALVFRTEDSIRAATFGFLARSNDAGAKMSPSGCASCRAALKWRQSHDGQVGVLGSRIARPDGRAASRDGGGLLRG